MLYNWILDNIPEYIDNEKTYTHQYPYKQTPQAHTLETARGNNMSHKIYDIFNLDKEDTIETYSHNFLKDARYGDLLMVDSGRTLASSVTV